MSEIYAAAYLAARGIEIEYAEKCGVDETFAPHLDVHPSLREGTHGVVIPYYNADGTPLMDGGQHFKRMRILEPPVKKGAKYVQGKGTGVHVYLCPEIDWQGVFADPSIPIVITEGEIKAMAMCQNGVACIALGGVNSIRSADGTFLPGTEGCEWLRRPTLVGFDSDQWKPNIAMALETLRAELSIEHKADVRVLTLPSRPQEGYDAAGKPLPDEKIGLDDYIVWKGWDALVELMNAAPSASKLDIAVLEINRDCAIIAADEKVYVEPKDQFWTFGFFKGQSEYSAIKLKTLNMGKKGPTGKIQEVSVATEWLSHKSARRFDNVEVNPNEPEVFTNENGGLTMNRWRGFTARPGDASPFLRLADYAFSDVEPEHREFVMNLVAYKAQNPGLKIPLAPFFIGTKRSGKSMWFNMLVDAFAPYGQYVQGSMLGSDFNGFVEKSLLIFIDDLTAEQMKRFGKDIELYVSESRLRVNEKFKVAQQMNNPSLIVMTTNEPEATSFRHDEGRYFVMRFPDKVENEAFYDDFIAYKNNGKETGAYTMNWLLNYDLRGWKPPLNAPRTYERAWAEDEGMDPIQKLASNMKKSTDNMFVYHAIDNAMAYAQALMNHMPANLPLRVHLRVANIKELMPDWPIRSFYSQSEIALMFPDLSEHTTGTKTAKYQHYTPQQISSALRGAGIKPLLNAAPGEYEFMWRGQKELYLVISDVKNPKWLRPLTQEEFELEMQQAESYADIKRRITGRPYGSD